MRLLFFVGAKRIPALSITEAGRIDEDAVLVAAGPRGEIRILYKIACLSKKRLGGDRGVFDGDCDDFPCVFYNDLEVHRAGVQFGFPSLYLSEKDLPVANRRYHIPDDILRGAWAG